MAQTHCDWIPGGVVSVGCRSAAVSLCDVVDSCGRWCCCAVVRFDGLEVGSVLIEVTVTGYDRLGKMFADEDGA